VLLGWKNLRAELLTGVRNTGNAHIILTSRIPASEPEADKGKVREI
jgi:hypothetical protein